MKKGTLLLFVFLFSLVLMGCSGNKEKENKTESTIEKIEKKEPDNKAMANRFMTFTDTFDAHKNNVRLVLKYESEENAFKGYLQNLTSETIKKVSVIIYIEGKEPIGPLSPVDLFANEKFELSFTAKMPETVKWLPDLKLGE